MFAIGTNNKIEEIEISPAIRKLKNKISLADCVVDIDRKLRDGRITFERENRSSNPNVLKISDTSDTKLDKLPAFLKTSNPPVTALTDNDKKIFKDYLGLNYVTTKQWEAYQNQSRYQIITGPTGSRKTLILLAKIFYLALTDSDSKIKFRVANHVDLVEYKSLFEKAGIKVAEVQYSETRPINQKELKNNQILIIHQPNFDLSDDFDFEFIDDYQINLCQNTDQEFSGKRFVLTVDLNQKPLGTKTTTAEDISQYNGIFRSADKIKLKASYRSTRNIVSQLITLSKLIRNDPKQTENKADSENRTEEQENQTTQMVNRIQKNKSTFKQTENPPKQKANNKKEKENQDEEQEKRAKEIEDRTKELQKETKHKENRTEELETQIREIDNLSHIPNYGHFIHGPQILVQVYRQDSIRTFHWDTIEAIFSLELEDPEIDCSFFFSFHAFFIAKV